MMPNRVEILVEVLLQPRFTSRGMAVFDNVGLSLWATEARFKVTVLSQHQLQAVELRDLTVWLHNVYKYTHGHLVVCLPDGKHGTSEPIPLFFPVGGLYFADAELVTTPPLVVIPKQRVVGSSTPGDGRAGNRGPSVWRTPIPVAERFAAEQAKLSPGIRWLTGVMLLLTAVLVLMGLTELFW